MQCYTAVFLFRVALSELNVVILAVNLLVKSGQFLPMQPAGLTEVI